MAFLAIAVPIGTLAGADRYARLFSLSVESTKPRINAPGGRD